jgi:hypothetical protein
MAVAELNGNVLEKGLLTELHGDVGCRNHEFPEGMIGRE